MRDAQDVLQSLVGNDDLLSQVMHHYILEREDGWLDIHICRIVAGTKAGTIIAVPKRLWHTHEQYYGRGRTEEEALYDCLQKVKGVPDTALFPQTSGDA